MIGVGALAALAACGPSTPTRLPDSTATQVALATPLAHTPTARATRAASRTQTQTPPPAETFAVYLPGVHVEPTATPTQTGTPTRTHTPAPTPTPTPAWPPALAGQTGSKLGLHVIRNDDPFIMEFVRRVHPRVMKAVDDLGWMADVKAAWPPTVTIGRLSGQDETWPDRLAPAEAARQYIAGQLERYRLNTGVDYWEGWNEFVPDTPARLSWYAAFEAERACQMQAAGLRAAVGGFSAGVPEYSDMALFLPALEAAHRCGGIFTLHEYNSPTLECGTSIGVPGVIPGAPHLGETPLGYHTLRYRFWYEGYLKPRGLGDLPLVISELGIQGPGTQCGDTGAMRGGWRTYKEWWVQQGYGADGPKAYVNTLAWYDAELRKDPYVLGATIFTAGAVDGSNMWSTFDVHDVLIPLAYYAVAQH